MKFETVLPYLREGKKIRRGEWTPGFSVGTKGCIVDSRGKTGSLILTEKDCLAEDWEIVNDALPKKMLEEVLPAYRDGKLIRATAIDGSQRYYIDDDRAPAYFPHWALREACWDILDEEK